MVFAHAAMQLFTFAANVNASRDLPFQPRISGDYVRQASRLIGDKGVHRVQDDGFDSSFAAMSIAEIQNGEKETFRLARACACGDECRLRLATIMRAQPLKRPELMGIRQKIGADFKWNLYVRICFSERQAQRNIGSLEQPIYLILTVLLGSQKIKQSLFHFFILKVEGGGKVIQYGCADFFGDG